MSANCFLNFPQNINKFVRLFTTTITLTVYAARRATNISTINFVERQDKLSNDTTRCRQQKRHYTTYSLEDTTPGAILQLKIV